MPNIPTPSNNRDTLFTKSNIYLGDINHRRFSPKKHSFNYRLYMLALDVSEIEHNHANKGIFGFSWYHPLRFIEKDYLKENLKENLKSEPFPLSQRITNKAKELNGYNDIARIVMLVQVRCFGIYFSPANFYFCYDQNNNCTQMLAEVSNTPWNERHYYLVDLLNNSKDKITDKAFQVSPFMDLDMSYYWRVIPPADNNDKLLVNIKNKKTNFKNNKVETLFDANLILKKQPFSQKALFSIWCQLPIMTVKIVLSIYWQALKLFIKRIPFIGYQKNK